MDQDMGPTAAERHLTPLVILALVAALVATVAMWTRERASDPQVVATVSADSSSPKRSPKRSWAATMNARKSPVR